MQDQSFRGLSMPSRQTKPPRFAVCLANDLDAEADDLIRVIDESGEEYLYPARLLRQAQARRTPFPPW